MLRLLSWNLNCLTMDKAVLLEDLLVGYDALLCMEWGRNPDLVEVFEEMGFQAYFNPHSVKPVGLDGRRGRGAGKGEGLCVLVRAGLKSRLLKHTPQTSWVEIIAGSCKIVLGAAYMHPAPSPHWRQDSAVSPAEARANAFTMLRDDALAMQASGCDRLLLMGDFNAHIGTEPDIDPAVQGILEDVGLGVGEAVSEYVPLTRHNQDKSRTDEMGQLLLEHLCVDVGLFLLNGRAHGDQGGACTRGAATLDYALTNASTYPAVRSFKVLPPDPHSDHQALECVLHVGEDPAAAPPGSGSFLPAPRWDPSKREAFVHELQSPETWDRIAAIETGLDQHSMSPVSAAESLHQILYDTAVKVFGMSGSPGKKLPSGRLPNRWYKHCKEEHSALKAAIRRGDTHAAAQYKKEFARVQRKWKRHYNMQTQARMLDDFRHNPRKFWTAFQGRRSSMLQTTMGELHSYWQGLYGQTGCGDLGETGQGVADFMQSLTTIAVNSPGLGAANKLNDEFEVEEVICAVKKLHSSRAPGPDGLRAEYLKGAYVFVGEGNERTREYILAPVLHSVFHALFTSGEYVRSWSLASLTPVFKKGDASDLDNYRAIAVGSLLGKLYAVLLDARLSVCAEKHKWRAEGQAGFRVGKSTVDHVFVLRYLIESRLRGGSNAPLVCCFVDFRKAYDKIRRDYLMKRLAELGVHGNMLHAIVQMYWSVPLVPKLDGRLGTSIPSTCGVKQGDPLSPLLFGLFIDDFETWVKQRLPRAGARLTLEKLVPLLLYADDMVLLGQGQRDVQEMLDLLHEFCEDRGLEVNVAKTEVVVFHKEHVAVPRHWQWHYNGTPIPRKSEFRYLGVIFHESKGISCAIKPLAAAARRAMWAMLSRFKLAGMTNIFMKLRMYKALVLPIMEYCSEVWSPDLLHNCTSIERLWDNELQKVQSCFLRQLGNLRRTVKTTVLHKEFCMPPVAQGWVRASLALWSRLKAAPVDSLLGLATRMSLRMSRTPDRANKRFKRAWAGRFVGMVHSIASSGRDPTGALRSFVDAQLSHVPVLSADGTFVEHDTAPLLAAPVTQIWNAWDRLLRAPWDAVKETVDPRTAPSEQVRLATYNSWFTLEEEVPVEDLEAGYPMGMARYIRHTGGTPFNYVKQLMRLRTGAHHLAIETGRWSRPSVPREDRKCLHCDADVVEDELHFLFECQAYEHIRQNYQADLFSIFDGGVSAAEATRADPALVRRFMDFQPASRVARYVFECVEYRRTANEATMSSEDISGSSSDMDESDLWTEESDGVSSSSLEDFGVNALGA